MQGNPNPNTSGLMPPFPPGVSANPGGRGKFSITYWLNYYDDYAYPALVAELANIDEKTAKQIAALRQLVYMADGKDAPLDRIWDRTEGKVAVKVEMIGTEQLEANRRLLKRLAGIDEADDTAEPSAD